MYTATLIGDTKNIELRRRMVNVEFTTMVEVTVTDPETNEVSTTMEPRSFNKEFQFRIDETIEVMKAAVKKYLDELNTPVPDITGDITDYVEPTPTEPTAAELARTAWDDNFAKLEKVKRLIDCGVLTGSETAVVALRDKVKTDFKAEYLS